MATTKTASSGKSHVKAAFRPDIVLLEIARLTTSREITAVMQQETKYRQIAASLEHVGMIEPVVVFSAGRGKYLILDGHKRVEILKSRGETQVQCLLATDDESYNYNKRVNYLSPIGEHQMILRALANGLTEERLAAALDVDVGVIRHKRDLLDGICPEAVETLRDRRVTPKAFSLLRKMKPARQIEVADLMVAAKSYTERFVRALYVGTRAELLVAEQAERQDSLKRVDAGKKAILEMETDALLKEFKTVEQSYGKNVIALTVCSRYLEKMVQNGRVQRYLAKKWPVLLDQIQQVAAECEADKQKSTRKR